MTIIISCILIAIFLFLSCLHIHWAFGGKWGSEAVIPTQDDDTKIIMPGLVPTLIVALGLAGFGFVVLINITDLGLGHISWLNKVRDYGLRGIICVFILRAIGEFNYIGFFKKHRPTKFAQNDTKYYSPLCLAIGLLALVIEFLK